jgi:hypothetical protein
VCLDEASEDLTPVMTRLGPADLATGYRDTYGRWHEDRRAEGKSARPAKWAIITLMLASGFSPRFGPGCAFIARRPLIGEQSSPQQHPPVEPRSCVRSLVCHATSSA